MRGEGDGEPFWKRAPLPPRAPPSPPKTFTQVGMARPRRRTQGLLSSLAGQGAGKGRRRKRRSQCGMCRRQQGRAGSAWGRRGYSKEKTEDGRKMPFVCHAAPPKSSRWRNRLKAGLVRYISELQKMVEDVPAGFFQQEDPVGRHAEKAGRARHTGRHGPDEKAFPFLRKKTAAQKPGDRHQGKGPGAGQAVRDLMERFWKGEGAWGRGRTFSPKRFPSPPRLIFKLQWQPRS